MYQTADSRNKEIVNVKLTIGQCKLINELLDEKLGEIEDGISTGNKNALKSVFDVFWELIKPTAAEKEERLKKWVSSLHLKGLNHG